MVSDLFNNIFKHIFWLKFLNWDHFISAFLGSLKLVIFSSSSVNIYRLKDSIRINMLVLLYTSITIPIYIPTLACSYQDCDQETQGCAFQVTWSPVFPVEWKNFCLPMFSFVANSEFFSACIRNVQTSAFGAKFHDNLLPHKKKKTEFARYKKLQISQINWTQENIINIKYEKL